jgi:hypothetical protein
MGWVEFAKAVAQVLLENEPEKFTGGSVERRHWLAMVMETQIFMMQHGAGDEFRSAILEEEA